MNIYLISQTDVRGWDTYDSAVVIAESEDAARNIDPGSGGPVQARDYSGWTSDPTKVVVRLLGKAVDGAQQEVVCASFNAG